MKTLERLHAAHFVGLDAPFDLDTFAGPGGWDRGLAEHLGMTNVLGIEWDGVACATRRAAGHQTVQADVAQVDLAVLVGLVRGLIGSPPCQLFSQAGSGFGRKALEILVAAMGAVAAGLPVLKATRHEVADLLEPLVAEENPEWDDGALPLMGVPTLVRAEAERLAYNACLVLEPARYAHRLRPEWIALEQVPAVLPLWRALAVALEELGYSTWTGVLNAADFGVPQTRKRAVLIAHRDRQVTAPAPTHAEHPSGDLLPWVTMADALGWPVGGSIRTGTNSEQGCGVLIPYERETDRPSPTVIGNAGRWRLQPGGWRADGQGNRRLHPIEEPAPTLAFGHDSSRWRWVADLDADLVLNTGRDWQPGGTRADAQQVALDRPAPAVTGTNGRAWRWEDRRNDQSGPCADLEWPAKRPATTVATRPLIPDPGANANRFNESTKSRNDGYLVEVHEAAILQSFPADYPWQGTRSDVFRQIGDAMPPRLAAHVVRPLIGCDS